MKNISFTKMAWTDYLSWMDSDQKKLKKINSLIEEITRTPFKGSGKPEPLKFKLTGYWLYSKGSTKDKSLLASFSCLLFPAHRAKRHSDPRARG